jgi:hypothetical protein
MRALSDFNISPACEKPLYLSSEDALLLLDMCVTPLPAQSPDNADKERLVMRLVSFYRDFRKHEDLIIAAA